MSSQTNILEDFQLEGEFAAEHGVSTHTVARYRKEPDGLPWMLWGGKVHIHVPGAREWLAKRIRRRAPLRVA